MDATTQLLTDCFPRTYAEALTRPALALERLLVSKPVTALFILEEVEFQEALLEDPHFGTARADPIGTALIYANTEFLERIRQIPSIWTVEKILPIVLVEEVIGDRINGPGKNLTWEQLEDRRDRIFELLKTMPGFLEAISVRRAFAIRALLPEHYTDRAFQRALEILRLPGITPEVLGQTERMLDVYQAQRELLVDLDRLRAFQVALNQLKINY
jgi:hypothetical protein